MYMSCPVWEREGKREKRAVPATVQFQEDEITPGSKVKVFDGGGLSSVSAEPAALHSRRLSIWSAPCISLPE